ncbi:MAG: hypothetical protein VX672_09895 [Planctomycetota bacterium]|nr:hypothetical protein [Planctomycetota bacterium]
MTSDPLEPWPTPIQRVGFFFAMSAEGAGFANSLGLEPQGVLEPGQPAHWYLGPFVGSEAGGTGRPLEVAVAFAGTCETHGVDRIGTVPAALGAHALIRRFQPDLLVNAGTCGGFKARGARVGSIYVGSKAFLFHDHHIPLPGFREFGVGRIPARRPEGVMEALGAKPGVVSTGDSFTPTEVELAFFESEGVHAKDMEAAAIARLAADIDLPFLAVKAVTDLVDDPEPGHDVFERNLARVSGLLQIRLESFLNWTYQTGHS